MSWEIETSAQVTQWLGDLDDEAFDRIFPVIDALERVGPTLGRPFADRIHGSRHHNMKELRSASKDIRILFAFDHERKAILLVAGEKTSQWKRWYQENVPIADDLFDRHSAGEKV
jgi:hypothetical protein